MNADVIDHVIKWCKNEMRMCESGNLVFKGGKEDALKTYRTVIKKLEGMR
jgi:hypothetical protein